MSARTDREPEAWEWKVEAAFNPHYFVSATAEGLSYSCEIQGPFCGHDAVGKQTWVEFLEVGPPAEFQMPNWIAERIRNHARTRRDEE